MIKVTSVVEVRPCIGRSPNNQLAGELSHLYNMQCISLYTHPRGSKAWFNNTNFTRDIYLHVY